MMRLDLPWDLVDEILSRVPATSLGRLRFTCKRWNALFKDPDFITKQFDKAAKQNLALMMSNFRIYSMIINLNEIQNVDHVDPSIKFTATFGQQVEITQVFHCNGLLLCSTKEADKTKLVVVNPCTGQTRWIEPRSGCNKHDDMYALGYENNNKKSYDSYKILRISYCYKLLEIFELKSNSWRVLPQIPPNMGIRSHGRGVFLKGNTYWLSCLHFNILCFDFTTEKFRGVPIPYQNISFYASALSVFREEQLLVLRWKFNMGLMEIWVSNKIDTETVLSWSKSFTFDFVSLRHLGFMSSVNFFIEEDKKVIVLGCGISKENYKDMIYIVEKHGWRELDCDIDQSNLCWPFFFSYVPSLVSLYPPM